MLMSLKKFLLYIPPINYLNILRHVINNYEKNLSELRTSYVKLKNNLGYIQEKTDKTLRELESIKLDNRAINSTLISMNNNYQSNTNRRTKLLANNHSLDKFYKLFEDRFRGSEEDIYNRLEYYLPIISSLNIDYKKYPIIDIGSGRGEFLKLMKDKGIPATGIEINKDMIRRSQEQGLKVEEGDAIELLKRIGSNRLGIITGFHIVEHIPFDNLILLFRICYETLTKDGVAIFETPNPENLSVGGCTFYMDPSHLRPIPPELLAFTLESCGFQKTEVYKLHPEKDILSSRNSDLVNIHESLYGPRDYSIIAFKSAAD